MFSVGLLQESAGNQGALSLQCPPKTNSDLSFQSTSSCHFTREDNQSQVPKDSNTSVSEWLSLPNLILWLIRDKLDIFDDIRLSAVCRDWFSASKLYPKLSVGYGLPWLMQRTEKSTEREFISVTRKAKFIIDLPDFSDSVVLSSKNGWFLMKKVLISGPNRRVVFLLNPFTKAKITLPSLYSFNPSLGSFSINKGYPRCVALINRCSNKLSFVTACPGDEWWSKHSFIDDRNSKLPYHHSLIIDEKVFCFGKDGAMAVYNMTTQNCKLFLASSDVLTTMEFEGDLLKVEIHLHSDTAELSFFRYKDNDDEGALWEAIDEDEVKDMSWFLAREWCFCARTTQPKAYIIRQRMNVLAMKLHPYDRANQVIRVKGVDVVVDDLSNGSRTVLDLPYRISDSANWVDIG